MTQTFVKGQDTIQNWKGSPALNQRFFPVNYLRGIRGTPVYIRDTAKRQVWRFKVRKNGKYVNRYYDADGEVYPAVAVGDTKNFHDPYEEPYTSKPPQATFTYADGGRRAKAKRLEKQKRLMVARRTRNKQRIRPRRRPTANRRSRTSGSHVVTAPAVTSMVAIAPGQRTVLKHQERICTVLAGESYSVPINPGEETFPWLSGIAVCYEFYTFLQLSFIYKPAVSTATDGRIVFAMDYDPKDAAPIDQTVLESYEGAVTGPLWQPTTLHTNKARLSRRKENYVRVYPTSPENARLTDIGNLHVIPTTSAAPGTEIGAIYAHYTICFTSPQRRALKPIVAATIPSVYGTSGANSYDFLKPTSLGGTATSELTGKGLYLKPLNSGRYAIGTTRKNTHYIGNITFMTDESAVAATNWYIGLIDATGSALVAGVQGVNYVASTVTNYLHAARQVRQYLIEFEWYINQVTDYFVTVWSDSGAVLALGRTINMAAVPAIDPTLMPIVV